MNGRLATIVLVIDLVFGACALGPRLLSYPLPGSQKGYEPAQPIAFSHRLHAGELQIACLYCHPGAEKVRHAGIPPAGTCMNCHRSVTAPLGAVRAEEDLAKQEKRKPRPVVSPELKKLYDALGLDDKLKKARGKAPEPIAWVRVHNLPAHAYFDHRAHLAAGLDCQRCHGPVETMERLRQVEDLSMGWCVNCHRNPGPSSKAAHASTDCATCHR
jgi:hypothetical protein